MNKSIFDFKLGPLKSFINAVETLQKNEFFKFFGKDSNNALIDTLAADFECFDIEQFSKKHDWENLSVEVLLFKDIYMGALNDFIKGNHNAFKIDGTRNPVEIGQNGNSSYLLELVFSFQNYRLTIKRRYLKSQFSGGITITPQGEMVYEIDGKMIDVNNLITNDLDAFAIEAIREGGIAEPPSKEEVENAQKLYDLNHELVAFLTRNKKQY